MSHFLLVALWPIIRDFVYDYQNSLVIIFIGAVSGLFAQMILPGRGFGLIPTVIYGVIASIVGNKLLEPIHKHLTDHKIINYIICGTVSTMALMFIINLVRGGRDDDKSHWGYN